jgi:hypothetical protein
MAAHQKRRVAKGKMRLVVEMPRLARRSCARNPGQKANEGPIAGSSAKKAALVAPTISAATRRESKARRTGVQPSAHAHRRAPMAVDEALNSRARPCAACCYTPCLVKSATLEVLYGNQRKIDTLEAADIHAPQMGRQTGPSERQNAAHRAEVVLSRLCVPLVKGQIL